tara:strand:- start:408 stop:734 length:327 start_codon:yes stop_codon:yes gene_type:complete
MADAVKPEETNTKTLTHEEIGAFVVPAVMSVREEVGDISAYKHIAMFALYKLFEFHNEVALSEMGDDDDAALCWARDAGWLQVCMNTLRNVGCGPNDTFVDTDDEDED